jgi:hypothetical protein
MIPGVRRADDGGAVSTLRVGLTTIRTAHLFAGEAEHVESR